MKIKDLSKKTSRELQIVLLIGLSLYYIVAEIYGLRGAYNITLNVIVVALVLTAVWLLFLNVSHSNFASYLVLLLLGYIDGGHSFIRWLFSYSFQNGFTGNFPLRNFLLFIGSIYLTLMAISYFIDEGFRFHRECFNLDQLLILFPVLMFLTYGINILLAVLVVEFVACNYRPIASHFLMLSKTIVIPFAFVRTVVTFSVSSLNLGQWILTVLAVYVIFLIIKDFFKAYDEHKNSDGSCEVTIE